MKVLSDVERAIHPESVDLNIFVTELVTNNGWKASDVKRISGILKRDRVMSSLGQVSLKKSWR